ncbi:glycosyltransferase [Bacillus sp. FJAT-50079]|uniref:glycosyltransferase n=1 Tax=Bacillus sp. FJAT-50079 TaxID=2833577 RepID=UPI001BCA63A8|nr:glycosyltransferase [Bacillus sp. FJAT-50079]MBS4208291.1 glycosyltransferase [Bacillus sp. FJAT-50079]
MNPFISLCMIVKNEEKVLERCLESVKDAVDEIVIVDTGSTDNTVEIATKYVDEVYFFEWTNSFADARNFAQSKATGSWILVLDADEYVDTNNLKEIINYIKDSKQTVDGYEIKVYNFTGNYGERIVEHVSIRIYRNDEKIGYFRGIHEQVTKKDSALTTDSANLIVYHSGYISHVVQEKNKSERNKALLEVEMERSGNTAFDYFNLGNELLGIGEKEKALEAYVNAYNKKPDFKYSWVSLCIIQIINCLISLKRYREALQVINDAEQIYVQSPDFKYLKANIYYLQHRYDDAMEPLIEVLGNEDFYSNCIASVDYKNYLPHQMLGHLYKEQVKNEEAVFHLVNALNINQYCMRSLYDLMNILVSKCTVDEVDSFIKDNGLIKDTRDIRKFIQTFISLSQFELANTYIQLLNDDPMVKKGFELKVDLIQNGGTLLADFIKTATVEQLNEIIGFGCLNIYDLIIFCISNEEEQFLQLLSNLIKEEKEKQLLLFLLNEKAVTLETSEFQEQYLTLLDKALQQNKYQLFESLFVKSQAFDNLYIQIGQILFENDYKDQAVALYEKIQPRYYDEQTIVHLLKFYYGKEEFKLASKLIEEAITLEKYNYKVFEYALDLLIKNEFDSTLDVEEIMNIAFSLYPNSNRLIQLYNQIPKQELANGSQSESSLIVGFFVETTFHYYVYESIIDELVKKGVRCHLVINDSYKENSETSYMYDDLLEFIQNLERNDIEAYTISTIRENHFIYDCMVSCYYTAWLQDIAKKQVRAMYSLAKDYWAYSWWNVFYDKILCYGEYDYAKLNIYNNCSVVGIPKFDYWYRNEIKNINEVKEKFILDSSKQTILYAPTYGNLSSIDEWIEDINKIQDDFNVVIKLHNGTAYRESEQYRRDLLNRNFHNITGDPDDLFALLSIADFVITDNSGMIFDAMLAEQNILLLNLENQSGIEKNRVEQLVRENLINIDKGTDLKEYLKNSKLFDEQRKVTSELVRHYYKWTDGNSGKLAADEIIQLLENEESDENTFLLSLRKQIFGN